MAEWFLKFLIQPPSKSPSYTTVSLKFLMVSNIVSSSYFDSFEVWKQSFKGNLGTGRTSRVVTVVFPIHRRHLCR